MGCITCTRVCNVPKCGTTVKIGTVVLLNTAVKVFVEHRARNKTIAIPVTTDGSGQVTISLTEPDADFWVIGFDYRVWVVDATSEDIYNLEAITLADTTTTDDCFIFQVIQLLDENFDSAGLTIELAASVT